MYMNSTKLLEFIAENNCLILFEKSVPAGRLKRECITLTTQDGRPVGFEMPRQTFDDFLAASLIEQYGREDADGRILFRLTPDGKARAAA